MLNVAIRRWVNSSHVMCMCSNNTQKQWHLNKYRLVLTDQRFVQETFPRPLHHLRQAVALTQGRLGPWSHAAGNSEPTICGRENPTWSTGIIAHPPCVAYSEMLFYSPQLYKVVVRVTVAFLSAPTNVTIFCQSFSSTSHFFPLNSQQIISATG